MSLKVSLPLQDALFVQMTISQIFIYSFQITSRLDVSAAGIVCDSLSDKHQGLFDWALEE